MTQRYDFWVHGADVNIEYPGRVNGHERRAGWGTTMQQDQGSENWVHFAIPSPTVMFDEEHAIGGDSTDTSVIIDEMWLKAKVNENAKVDRIHAWDGDNKFFTKNGISGLENQKFRKDIDVNHELAWGLNMSVHLQCMNSSEQPEVTWLGAGAKYQVG